MTPGRPAVPFCLKSIILHYIIILTPLVSLRLFLRAKRFLPFIQTQLLLAVNYRRLSVLPYSCGKIPGGLCGLLRVSHLGV